MEVFATAATILAAGIGVALVFHGFHVVTIHKHYHYGKEERESPGKLQGAPPPPPPPPPPPGYKPDKIKI